MVELIVAGIVGVHVGYWIGWYAALRVAEGATKAAIDAGFAAVRRLEDENNAS